MIEIYAFLVMFAVQILLMSVVLPAWFVRNFRAKVARVPAERLAQLYPGVDVLHVRERFLTQYRVLTTTIALLGLLLLGWLFTDLRSADWNRGKAESLTMLYFALAFILPVLFSARFAVRFNKEHKLAEGKRTAILQRRGLFDFVSPLVVFIAVLSYFLYAAFVIYVDQHPFPGFAGSLVNIAGITLIYAGNAFALYITLYRGKKSPLETHAGRLHTMSLAVKGIVYMSIVIVLFCSLGFWLRLLDLTSWGPFAHSTFFTIGAILASMGFAAPPREPVVDELSSNPVS